MSDEVIHLLHTNDLHSHLENWSRITHFLQRKKAEYQQAYTFDIGDAIDRLHPLTDATLGQANVDLMNSVHYDGVTIGNNEGLVLPHEAMSHLYDHANFDVLISNLKNLSDDSQPSWALPYKIITTTYDTKIAVFAMTAPYVLTYPSLGWQPHDVDETISELLPVLKEKADVIVLLSHLGLPVDEEIAKKYDIDVIIGAHTHHLLEKGKVVNGTLLAAAGRYGNYVGDITITINHHAVVEKIAKTVPTYELDAQDDDYEQVRDWLQHGEKQLKSQYVTKIPRSITADEQVYDALRALKQCFDVPVAMVSTGMFVEDLPQGTLSRYELLESMPHAINPMVITLSGQELIRLLAEIERQQAYLSTFPMKGSGFRGKIFGYMRFDGIDRLKDGQVLYNNQKIIMDQQYTIATLDHYKWVPFFPAIQEASPDIRQDILLRELMANYYQQKYQ